MAVVRKCCSSTTAVAPLSRFPLSTILPILILWSSGSC
jgi:hypothetical protein